MNIEFKFKIGDVVYLRRSRQHVQQGTVTERQWIENKDGHEVRYHLASEYRIDRCREESLFRTPEEAFAL